MTVQVTRTDLPTFFARIWGTTTVGVQASAAAEAYNPSGASALPLGAAVTPVAPTCVKPWVLPNISPPGGVNNKIIDAATGAILDTSLVGRDLGGTRLYARCGGNCQPNWSTNATPIGWRYYPADPASFPSPVALPACAATLVNAYQLDIAGCVPAPITCGTTANGGTPINLDTSSHFGRNSQTADAVNCLTHTAANVAGDADSLSPAVTPGEPFEFLGGNNNPVPGAVGNNVIVSDSLVTVPIYDADSGDPAPTSPVTVIGFVQLLLNSDGVGVSDTAPNSGRIKTTVINVVGCGNGAPLPPILGNGASPVPVRLITPP